MSSDRQRELARERTRLWRARRRAGHMILPTEVSEQMVEALVSMGWLSSWCADSRDAIQSALRRLHEAFVNSVTRHDTQ